MKTSSFEYHLPEELIAQEPVEPRDGARMLVADRARKTLEHARISDLPKYLAPGDLLVMNDTRVIPARLIGRKPTGGRMEILLVEPAGGDAWDVMIRAGRPMKAGGHFKAADGALDGEVLESRGSGRYVVSLRGGSPLEEILNTHGITPLPPYIRRNGDRLYDEQDRERYQTIYARAPGAVAAPTAGLHFTPRLFEQLEARGARKTFLTLHVGPGTFRPVKTEDVSAHEMETERYRISPESARDIHTCRAAGHRCVAVGSTSVRTLETAAEEDGTIRASEGRTDLFIYPPYRFKAVDAMLTNFHLPRSTLLMMVCALGGRELIMEAYAHAVREKYRFYSYGDAMLIL